jgi:hypothetical protein
VTANPVFFSGCDQRENAKEKLANLLEGMILNLQLDTATLSADYHPANDTTLHPNFTVLANNNALWFGPGEISLKTFNDIDLLPISHKSFLALPSDGCACLNLIFDAGQPRAKRYR